MLTACLLIFSTLVPPLFGVRPPTLKKTELAPRLAIVLSGGGAKCAYQLGAVEVIEDKLDASSAKGNNLKIDLVVGTSGGAINALTVAAGATSNQSTKRGALHSTWQNFGQTEILKPSDSFRRLIGVTVGILFSFFLIYVWYLLRRYLLFRKPKLARRKVLAV
jgi:predicted acylesterase/phospholipase RssA